MPAATPSHLFDQGLAGGVEADNADLGTVRSQLFLRAFQRGDRVHSSARCKLLISLAMPVSTINCPMTSATARYADSLRLSVAPMMDWITKALIHWGLL